LVGVAGGDDLSEPVGDGVERGRVGRCGRVCGECECLVLGLEGVQARVEGRDALLEARGVQGAVLEGVLVALDRAFGAGDLLGE
jgi:hypothetical protein